MGAERDETSIFVGGRWVWTADAGRNTGGWPGVEGVGEIREGGRAWTGRLWMEDGGWMGVWMEDGARSLLNA